MHSEPLRSSKLIRCLWESRYDAHCPGPVHLHQHKAAAFEGNTTVAVTVMAAARRQCDKPAAVFLVACTVILLAEITPGANNSWSKT